jgi:2-amino-4-hydroxy-6-hydroxymethyldihydropteridine diphosphokinase
MGGIDASAGEAGCSAGACPPPRGSAGDEPPHDRSSHDSGASVMPTGGTEGTTRDSVLAYVGVGSNMGDREAAIDEAIDRLRVAPGVLVTAVSHLYQTEPWGYLEQAPFLNAVAALQTVLGPGQALILLKMIERQLGREKTVRWGPRRIDLDLLLYGDQKVTRRDLTVPHPSIDQRAFVLVPLRDVCPGYRSTAGEPIEVLLAKLDASGVDRA